MNKIIAIAALLFALPAFADEHGHEEKPAGIELSAEAVENYGIETARPAKQELQTLNRDALVVSRGEYFIYEREDGRFREVEIHPEKITAAAVVFRDADFACEKEYVSRGAKYLRIIFLNNDNPEEGHGH